MDFLSTYLPLIVSFLALLISILTWRRTHKENLYDACDHSLNELVKLSLQYPQYRDEELCLEALNSEDAIERLRYDGFAVLVWNYLETLYDKLGDDLEKSPFYGSMKSLGHRHRHWLFKDDNYQDYPLKLIDHLNITRPRK